MPLILKIYRDFTKGLAPFSLDEILKRERIWKVFLLLCSLLALGFIFFAENGVFCKWYLVNYNSIEFFCLCLKTRVILCSIINFSSVYMSLSGWGGTGDGRERRVSVDIVKEIQGEKERIRGKSFTEQGSHGTGQINFTAAWSISLPIRQEAENKFYILLTQVRITLAFFQSCWDDQLLVCNRSAHSKAFTNDVIFSCFRR